MIRVALGILILVASLASGAVRVLQTNAAGDNVHVIDPATNKVVGVIEDIEIPHGVLTPIPSIPLFKNDKQ